MLPRTKFGDCSKCGATDTNVVKIGRELFCLSCNRQIKVAKYEASSRQKTKVRSLVKEQVKSGNYFQAERQVLMNDLDYVTRRIVKLMAVNERGWANCYICDTPTHIDKAQAMHFIKRAEMALRWDFRRNLRYGCKKCNEILDGNMVEYEKRLNEEYPGLPEQLREEAKEISHISREELKQTLISYRAILNNLEKKLAPHLK